MKCTEQSSPNEPLYLSTQAIGPPPPHLRSISSTLPRETPSASLLKTQPFPHRAHVRIYMHRLRRRPEAGLVQGPARRNRRHQELPMGRSQRDAGVLLTRRPPGGGSEPEQASVSIPFQEEKSLVRVSGACGSGGGGGYKVAG